MAGHLKNRSTGTTWFWFLEPGQPVTSIFLRMPRAPANLQRWGLLLSRSKELQEGRGLEKRNQLEKQLVLAKGGHTSPRAVYVGDRGG